MATKLNAGDYTRGEKYLIYPEDIVIVHPSNGRTSFDGMTAGHTAESIQQMADSLAMHGQQQPCVIRKIEDNKALLVAGYRRLLGMIKYNTDNPDKRLKLKCDITTCNDEEALTKNVVENEERKGTTPVDHALTQRRFREDYGWTDSRIAELYGQSVSYVSQLKKLTTLESTIQERVHLKQITLESALLLADLSSEDRAATMAELSVPVAPIAEANGEASNGEVAPTPAPATNGKLSTADVKRKVREKKQAKGKKVARSLSEVRTFFEELTGPAESEGVRKLSSIMLGLITGKLSDKKAVAELNALLPDEGGYGS